MGCSVWAKHAQFSIRTILYYLLPQQGLAGEEDEQQQKEDLWHILLVNGFTGTNGLWGQQFEKCLSALSFGASLRSQPSSRRFSVPPVTTPLLPGAAGSFENENAWLEPVKGLPELGTPGRICVEGSGRALFLPSFCSASRTSTPTSRKEKCVSEAFSPGCRWCG